MLTLAPRISVNGLLLALHLIVSSVQDQWLTTAIPSKATEVSDVDGLRLTMQCVSGLVALMFVFLKGC